MVSAYGKTILFEIDTSGIDLTTLPSLVHRANRPQILFEKTKRTHGFYLWPSNACYYFKKIYPRGLVWGTKKMMVSVQN